MKKIALIACAAVLALGMGTASAGGADLYAAKGCAGCHGVDAQTPIPGQPYPKLAGQNADYALAQMKDIKSGARANGQSAAMKGVVTAVSDAEMKEIADWLSTL